MRGLAVLLSLGVVLVIGACSQWQIHTDFDPKASFSTLHTYAWYSAEQPQSGDPRVDDPMLDMHIRNAVEAALNARGYEKVDADPNFVLVYHALVTREIEVTTKSTPVYPAGYYGWRYVVAPTWVEEPVARTYSKGSLILDVIDTKSDKMIWRGSIQAELDRTATPDIRTARINAAVKEMLATFPPGSAK